MKHHVLAEGGSREAVKALNSRARGPRRPDHRLRTKPGYLSAGMRVVQDRGAMSGGDVVSIRRWRAYSTSEVGGEVPGDGAVSEPRELRSRLSATRGRGERRRCGGFDTALARLLNQRLTVGSARLVTERRAAGPYRVWTWIYSQVTRARVLSGSVRPGTVTRSTIWLLIPRAALATRPTTTVIRRPRDDAASVVKPVPHLAGV